MTEVIFPLRGKRIWVAGHKGMVGSAIVRRLRIEDCEILTADRAALDLRDQASTRAWIASHKPDSIIVAAARVGGILANSSYPADFLFDNLIIESNIIEAAFRNETAKVMFLGSSCIYPRLAPQPIVEESLLTGPLEKTNEWYAIAKIAGIKLCQAYREQHGRDFIAAMPTNLYGPGDNYDLNTSHVLPALIRKAHEAKVQNLSSMVIWGTGTPRREFMHVDDCADGVVFLLKHYSGAIHINVGSGNDVTVLELAKLVCKVVGFHGEIANDLSKPDGTPRKQMSSERLFAMGWAPRIALEDGIRSAYESFRQNQPGSL
ncbi:MAG: GDP-L-fucose synthase [Alphaproteobacteria bacterium]|nr:GDP-L-fucose synthase [Alphaproteobacteria bacterium]MBL7099806.1 GDP-L-fucose synthase [Alphaproteobacteria bacterium]